MQKNEVTDTAYGVLNVPLELLDEAGITRNSVIQFHVEDGKLIIQTVEPDDDYVCDGDCEDCVFVDDCPYEDEGNDDSDEDSYTDINDEDDEANENCVCDDDDCEFCEYYCHHCKRCVLPKGDFCNE